MPVYNDPRRVPDPESLPDRYASVFSDSSPSTSAPSRLGSPIPLSPAPTIDTLGTTTLQTAVTAAALLARATFHLFTFTAGLYLASSVFTTLAPLLDDSWIWGPAVFTASALAALMAPFWGLLLAHLLGLPKMSADQHTPRSLASIGVGLGLAALTVLVALGALVRTTLPCHEATLHCAADSAITVGRAMVDTWETEAPHLATTVSLMLVPLAAAWWYTTPRKDAPAPAAHYVFVGLRAVATALGLLNVWLVLALSCANEDLKAKLEACGKRCE